MLFIIGLPRSGTSLVHKLVHEATGRRAPTFSSFGLDVSRVPRRVKELNRTFKDAESLAEDNDFRGTLREYRTWLETRGDKWVCKSPDHLGQMPELLDVFPEARFLWVTRNPQETLASIREYYQVTGMVPEYKPDVGVKKTLQIARVHPEIFHTIKAETIPEFESAREPILSIEAANIAFMYQELRGTVRNVASRDFKELYS